MATAAKKVPQPAHVVLGDDGLLCRHCGATEKLFPMKLTPKRIQAFELLGEAFSEEHAGCKETEESPSRRARKNPDDWIHGGDTGTSSETIWSVMTGHPVRRTGHPLDPDDFGRCYRLLKLFPDWRARMPEVAAKFKAWGPLVREWDKLTALYEEEVPNHRGRAPKLYDAMKACREEAGVL